MSNKRIIIVCLVSVFMYGCSGSNDRVVTLEQRLRVMEGKVNHSVVQSTRTLSVVADTRKRLSEIDERTKAQAKAPNAALFGANAKGSSIPAGGNPVKLSPAGTPPKGAPWNVKNPSGAKTASKSPFGAGNNPFAKLVKKTPANATPARITPVKAVVATSSADLSKSPAVRAYEHAYGLYQKKEYVSSERALSRFLDSYPKSSLAPNALYWIGETYYARGKYADAIMSFKEVQTRYPKSRKTADSLLKIAMSYRQLGDANNAKLHLSVLKEDWPNSAAVRLSRTMDFNT